VSGKPYGAGLFKAEQHLRLFVEEVRDYALLMLDPDGIVMTWNSGAKAIKGYEAREIVGQHFSVFYTPGDIANGKPERGLCAAAQKGRFSDVGERVRKDGTRFWADVVITPIRNQRGRLLGFGKITRDISERAAAEERLQASQTRLRSLVGTVLDTLADGLIIIDRKGRVRSYNRACQTLFGYDAEKVIGKNVKMLMPAATREEHDQYLRNYQRTGVRKIIGISREVVGRREDGSTFPMHLSVGETSHGGEPIYIGIIRDLTERNRTEAQLRQSQKMEAVGQLTGGIAHDFNNILMVIMANTDALLESRKLSLPTRRRLERIGKATGRASDLTRQLLAFSRKQALQPRLTNLNELVAATGKLLRRTLDENIKIETILAKDLWIASIDPAQLDSALVNLCLNARDAMPAGGRLLIETSNQVLDGDYVAQNADAVAGPYVLLSVTDTGYGIPAELLSRVFEPFFTTKGIGKGTGLGLSMVYGFIKQSNGHIKIYSEIGQGTTIRLYLPKVDGSADEQPEANTVPLPRGHERILVVEDDAQVRAGVVEQLRSLGYHVVEASDGQAGLATIESTATPYDLLLTDVVMPGRLGGKALAEEVQRRWPRTRVVFMSGYTENAMIHEGRLDPSVRLLTKPFHKDELAKMIRNTLDLPLR
jgi:PAS domain S-box-containing protein